MPYPEFKRGWIKLRWRSSYVAFYCPQFDTVMHIAKIADVKFEDINAGDAKMMTLTIFQCIHQNLRVVYVGQQDPLANGHTLWTTLELRFQTVDQVARRKEYRKHKSHNFIVYKIASLYHAADHSRAPTRRVP